MAIGDIQKNLQSKIRKGSRSLEPVFIWDADINKCFDSINHDWLLKNVPFPSKYKYILKNWLKLGHIEFKTNVELTNDTGIPQGGIISPLLMNFTLNGMEDLINNEIVEYQKVVPINRLKGSFKDETKLYLFHKLSDGNFKERQISWRFFRYAGDFIIICSSSRLLSSIQRITKEFLQQRGLEIHPSRSKTFLFKINQPFDFLSYTFVYLIRTKSIRRRGQDSYSGYQNLAQCIFSCRKIPQLPKSLQSVCVIFFAFVILQNGGGSIDSQKSGLIEFAPARKAVFWILKPSVDVLQLPNYRKRSLSSGRPWGSPSNQKYAKYQYRTTCTTVSESDSAES